MAISNLKSETSNHRERRLFEDGKFYTSNGKAKLLFSPPADSPEPADAIYPFVLLTGRGTSSQWHTLTRTGKSDILNKLCPVEAYVEMNCDDAAVLGLKQNDSVVIRSRRAEMRAWVYIAPTMQRGQVFIPMHYPEVNRLTSRHSIPTRASRITRHVRSRFQSASFQTTPSSAHAASTGITPILNRSIASQAPAATTATK